MATTELLDFARPAEAAAAVDSLNDELARAAHVPAESPRTWRGSRPLSRDPLERWTAATRISRCSSTAPCSTRRPRSTEGARALRIALERLSHALAALGETEEVGERARRRSWRGLVGAVEVPQRDLAELLGVDLRRFQRWISARERTRPEGEEARRLRALARLVGQLRRSFTPAGVIASFDWPAPSSAARRRASYRPTPSAAGPAAGGRSTRSTAFA